MQTVLALPVQQKMRYSPAAALPTLTASPTPTLTSATSPSTSSTLSDSTSYSVTTNTDAHIHPNLGLKINTTHSTRIIIPPKTKRTANRKRDPNVPFQYTFPTFPPSPGPSSASPTSEPVEQTQRLTRPPTPNLHLKFSPDAHNPGLQCSVLDGLLPIPDSGMSPGPGPERHPKSGLGRLLDQNPQLAHPYARLSEKEKDAKRRKIWNHTLEKNLFTPEELSNIGAPKRRPTYIASLEAHIDRIHTKLYNKGGWYPVPYADLEPFTGLNSKTAKSMVSGLQSDAIVCKLKLLELNRINLYLEKMLLMDNPFDPSMLPGPPGTEFIADAVSSNYQ